MTLVIKTTSWEDYLDPSGEAYVKALIMGAHGAGKTRSASFWPGVIFADCESGRMSLADRAVPYADVRSTAQMDALLELLRKECQKPAPKRKYRTLVIDTVDAYQRTIIQERLRSEKKESLSGWADWGYLDGKMVQLIEKLLNLPMNIVVNLHVKEVSDGGDSDDGDSSILVRKARLKGDIKDTIFQDFDLIGQMETSYRAVKGERILERNIRWQAEPRFPNLRDRSGKLPRFTTVDFTEDDYWRIFNALTAGIDELPNSTTLETIETGPTDAEVRPAGPDEKGGPVAPPEMPPKGARKTAAKKTAAKAPAKTAEPKVTIEEPEPTKTAPDPAPTAPDPAPTAPDPEAPAPDPVNGKGTEDVPVVLDQSADIAQQLLDEGTLRSLEHAHASDGTCVKNKFGEPCTAPEKVCTECGNDLAAEGLEKCTECLEKTEPAKAEPTEEEAAAVVAAELGATPVDRSELTEDECGYQPETYRKFEAPAGCGADISGMNKAKANLTVLRAKAKLCDDCFAAFKAA